MLEIYRYELARVLRKPWFYITTLILPILILCVAGIPTLLTKYILNEMKEVKIAIIGEEEFGKQIKNELLRLPFINCEIEKGDIGSLKDKDIIIEAKEKEVIIKMKERAERIEFLIEKAIRNAYLTYELIKKGLAPQEIEKVRAGISVKLLTLEGKEKGGRYFNLIIYLIFYAGILGFGDFLARRIIVDKESNFIDILLLYKSPSQIFWSKLFSIVTSYFIYIVITFFLAYLLLKLLPSHIPVVISNLFLKQVDGKYVFLISVIFFTGFLMYSSFYLFAGGVSNTEDSLKSYSAIINLFLSSGLLINAILNPLPPLKIEKVLYYIPFITPFFMLRKQLGGNITASEFIAGCFLMLFTVIVFIKIASKKYEISSLYKRDR